MDKEFETWWTINKFKLMENDENGIREIALAAFLAGKQTAQSDGQKDIRCVACKSLLEDTSVYCDNCGTDVKR